MNRKAVKAFWPQYTLAILFTLSTGAWSQSTHQIDVNRGTVVYASGNDVTIQMEDGALWLVSVPSDYRLSVDGKEVSVRDLKPGTKLTQVITTTAEKQIVTEVRTVDVKVLEAKPPFLTVASGNSIRHLRVPEGTTFTIDGKQMTLADLRKDMRVKGTVITAVPTTVMASSSKVTGKSPKRVAAPVIIGVLLIEQKDK